MITDSKTAAGVREIHLSPYARQELELYKDSLSHPPGDVEPVFPVRGGGASDRFNLGRRLQHIVRVATELRRARIEASLPSRITPHTLRRTFITLSIQAGRDLVFVQTQAGHADWKTTLEIYTQQSVRSIEPTIRQLLEHLLGEEESPTRARLLKRSDILDGR